MNSWHHLPLRCYLFRLVTFQELLHRVQHGLPVPGQASTTLDNDRQRMSWTWNKHLKIVTRTFNGMRWATSEPNIKQTAINEWQCNQLPGFSLSTIFYHPVARNKSFALTTQPPALDLDLGGQIILARWSDQAPSCTIKESRVFSRYPVNIDSDLIQFNCSIHIHRSLGLSVLHVCRIFSGLTHSDETWWQWDGKIRAFVLRLLSMLVPKDASPKDFLWHQNCPLLPTPDPQRKGHPLPQLRSFWNSILTPPSHLPGPAFRLEVASFLLPFHCEALNRLWHSHKFTTHEPHMTKNKSKCQLSTWQITANHKNQIEQNIYNIYIYTQLEVQPSNVQLFKSNNDEHAETSQYFLQDTSGFQKSLAQFLPFLPVCAPQQGFDVSKTPGK